MNELDLVDWLRAQTRPRKGDRGGLVLGIGDDCAIFRPRPGEDLLFTTDQMLEGVHFTRDLSPARIGERALARNLSDIAAMGGEPRFCLVSLAAPAEERWIKAFFRGLLNLARAHRTVLAGGDLARSAGVYCDVAVCGSVPRGQALRRDGARPGDLLYVSGRLGKPYTRRIEPRLALGRALRGRATACIDLSDGLSLDLRRLCLASGVAAVVDRVPVARGATLERALHGGEDYELLFTLPPRRTPPPGTTCIGRMVRGISGMVEFQGSPLAPRGYDHFRPLE
jgi:thiamine-monophosphate kinase